MNEVEKIQAELNRAAQIIAQFGPKFDAAGIRAAGALRHGRDRSFIVRAIVYFYVSLIALVVLYLLLFRGVWLGEAVFSDVVDVAKWAILPPFMLIIGYYFGTQTR
jgi:hypothetical protein